MKPLLKFFLTVSVLTLMSSCARHNEFSDMVSVIPEPQEVRLLGGFSDADDCDRNDVTDRTLGDGEYRIFIKNGRMTVTASSSSGFLYAGQTLRQLRNAEGKYPDVEIRDWPRFSHRGLLLDCSRHFFSIEEVCKVLDVMALHKLNVLHWHLTDDQGWRIETGSWPRLTEVGAWRTGNRLGRGGTDVGPDDESYGGFYTKEELRSVVEYAASLGIDIMPEIDLPGHMLAALASYPELGCTGGPYEVSAYGGISQDVLCAGNEKTYKFIEEILTEVMDIFPYEYIHIGGDECPKDRWKACPKCQARIKALGIEPYADHTAEQLLQGYVTRRVGTFLKEHGRRMVGWDEILEGGAPPDAVVMSWRGSEGGIKASGQGHDVIMTPNLNMYLDYCQSENKESEPDGIGGYVPVWKVYEYEPFTLEMTNERKSHILGVQANLWTEFISTDSHLEYMLLPRLAALSEVQWCEPGRKSFDRFMKDISRMTSVYEELGCDYAKHVFGVVHQLRSLDEGVEFTFHTAGDGEIRYTVDGSEPTTDSRLYSGPFVVSGRPSTVKAAVYRDGMRSETYSGNVLANKACRKSVTIGTEKAWNYKWQPDASLVDGLRGGTNFNTDSFVAWNEEPMEVTLDLGSPVRSQAAAEPVDRPAGSADQVAEPVEAPRHTVAELVEAPKHPSEAVAIPTYSSVTLCILVDKLNYIFAPSSIEVCLSDDGEDFDAVAHLDVVADGPSTPDGLREIPVSFQESNARYIRVKAPVVYPIPDWHPGRGHHAFIFVDEIVVE